MEGAIISKSSLTWVQPRSFYSKKDPVNQPLPRNGHSFVIVAGVGFLFGGTIAQGPCSTNELFTLRLGVNDVMWERLTSGNDQIPPGRSQHSVTEIGNKFIIFGGSANSNLRLNDMWIFDTLQMSWMQPNMAHNNDVKAIIELSANSGYLSTPSSQVWKNVPSPRCGHSMTLIGDRVWVFGGYGGGGYSRRDLDDLYCMQLDSWTWTKVQARGICPEKRSDHQACAVGTRLYVIGGRCSSNQYADVWMLETVIDPPVWTSINSPLPIPRWSHCAVSVPAIPSWKIFVFGGYHGRISSQSRTPAKTNSVAIMDTEILRWMMPEMIGSVPCPLSDARMCFDQKGSRLVLVGGCGDEWTIDTYALDVGGVVGPPYALTGILPKFGPCTGGSDIDLIGLDFPRCKEAVVRFGDSFRSKDVIGSVVSSTKITCQAPRMEMTETSGAEVSSEVRVAMNGESFTTTCQIFKFFSVTDAKMCIAFGPGLLNGGAIGEETTFIIVARDNFGNPRTTGGDEFKIRIVFIGGDESEDVVLSGIRIRDTENGKYVVSFSAPYPGDYELYAEFLGTFGGRKGLLGISGSRVKFDEMATRDNNSFAGPLMTKTISKDIDDLHETSKKTNDGLGSRVWGDEWAEDEVIDALARIKELINDSQRKKDDMIVSFEKCSTVLAFMKNINAVDTIGMEVKLQAARELWTNVSREAPLVLARVLPLIRSHATTVKEKVHKFDQEMQILSSETFHCPATDFESGLDKANFTIRRLEALMEDFSTKFVKLSMLANVYGCLSDMDPCRVILDENKLFLNDLGQLWKCIAESMNFINQVGSLLWQNLDGKGTEDNVKITLHSIRKFSRKIRDCNSYQVLEKNLLDFQSTCPILVCLKSPCIRDRHWKEIMRKIGKEIPIPTNQPNLIVSQILQLNLNSHVDFIRELQDRSEREDRHEKEVATIEKDLSTMQFQSMLYKESRIVLYFLSKESKYLLESHQQGLLGIITSKNSFFRQAASSINDELGKMIDIEECLQNVQALWKYLESFFLESEEVRQALSSECDRFAAADNEFRQIIRKIGALPNVRLTANEANLSKNLHRIETELEICRKGLVAFLNVKRQQIPRLFFLCESDLLDIVSNSSSPKLSLSHISKLLRNISEISMDTRLDEVMNEEKLFVVSFKAVHGGEEIDFMPAVSLDGKLERYLMAIQSSIETTLRKHTATSMKRFASQARQQWCIHKSPDDLRHRNDDSCQIMLLVARMRQVLAVESGIAEISRGISNGIQQQIDITIQQLNDLNDLLKTPLSVFDRLRISSLIIQDIHHRDVMSKLVELKATSTSEFNWQCQLRPYYTVLGEELLGGVSVDFNMSECSIPYGFEYIGNLQRLVITPESDRIFCSVARALHYQQFCNLVGQCGSSKTNMLIEYTSCIGKSLMIFDCCSTMDLVSLTNCLKGCVTTGTWSCIRNFNSIKSSVALPFTSLLVDIVDKSRTIQPGNRETAKMLLSGDEIYLSGLPVIFFTKFSSTFNSNFANISQRTRPISIHRPDIRSVTSVLLCSFGFRLCNELSNKMINFIDLCRSNLPSRAQYAFDDQRILQACYNIPKIYIRNMEKEESWSVAQSLCAEFYPCLVDEDRLPFSSIADAVFGKANGLESKTAESTIAASLAAACEACNLWPDDEFLNTAVRLHEFLEKQRACYVLGETGSGKTSLWKAVLKANQITHQKDIIEVYQDCYEVEQIFGGFDDVSKSWKDGILTKNVRLADQSQKCIAIFDGSISDALVCSIHSIWSRGNMTLSSSERIQTPNIHVIMETDQLSNISPSSVSKSGMVYLNRSTGSNWQGLMGCWIQRVPESILGDDNRLKLHEVMQKMVVGCLQLLTTLELSMVLPHISLVSNLLKCLDSVLPLFSQKEESSSKKSLSKEISEDNIVDIFSFCAFSAFGGVLYSKDGDNCTSRIKFSDWWRQTSQNDRIPSRDTVFDYWLNPATRKFESWKTSEGFQSLSKAAELSGDVFVPTADNVSSFHWTRLLCNQLYSVNIIGVSGCGKTAAAKAIMSSVENSDRLCNFVSVNRLSNPQSLQKTFESRMIRTRSNAVGPPSNFLGMTIFLDDIHLGSPRSNDKSSSWALIRQMLDKWSWYSFNGWDKTEIERTSVISTCNSGVISKSYDKRLFRHFSNISVTLPLASSLISIFQTILDNHFRLNGFQPIVATMSSIIARTSVTVHKDLGEALKLSNSFSSKSLSLCVLTNVIQGIQLTASDNIDKPEKLAYLWLHEMERCYCDRLSLPDDIGCFKHIITNACKKSFPQYNLTSFIRSAPVDDSKMEESKDSEKSSDGIGLIFSHNYQAGVVDPCYDRIESLEPIKEFISRCIEERRCTKATSDISLLDDFLFHILRLSRSLSIPKCHGAIFGDNGCGKFTIAKLASIFCGHCIIEVKGKSDSAVRELRTELQNGIRKMLNSKTALCVLVPDECLLDEIYMIAISELIKTNKISDLYSESEAETLLADVTTNDNLRPRSAVDHLWQIISSRIHCVLCIRQQSVCKLWEYGILSLLDSCYVDRIQRLSADNFNEIGLNAMKYNIQDIVRVSSLENPSDDAETLMTKKFEHFFKSIRFNYDDMKLNGTFAIDPTGLRGINILCGALSKNLTECRVRNENEINQTNLALDRLRQCKQDVVTLGSKLKILMSEASEKRQECEELKERQENSKREVEAASSRVRSDESVVAEADNEERRVKKDIESEFASAAPILASMEAAIDSINLRDLSAVKSMFQAPRGCEEVFACIIVLFAGIDPAVAVQKNGRVKDKDRQWEASKRVILANAAGFLDCMRRFKVMIDEGAVPPVNWTEARPYFDMESIEEETLNQRLPSASSLFQWAKNVCKYHDIVDSVEPKRVLLESSRLKLQQENDKLSLSNIQLQACISHNDNNILLHDESTRLMQQCETDAENGKLQLSLSSKIVSSIGFMEDIWTSALQRCKMNRMGVIRESLIGTCLSVFVSLSEDGNFCNPEKLIESMKSTVNELFGTYLHEVDDEVSVFSAFNLSQNEGIRKTMNATLPKGTMSMWQTCGATADYFYVRQLYCLFMGSNAIFVDDPFLSTSDCLSLISSSCKNSEVKFIASNSVGLQSELSSSIEIGSTTFVNGSYNSISSLLQQAMTSELIVKNHKEYKKIGDNEIELSHSFKIIVVTSSNNGSGHHFHKRFPTLRMGFSRKHYTEPLMILLLRCIVPDAASFYVTMRMSYHQTIQKTADCASQLLDTVTSMVGDPVKDRRSIENIENNMRTSDESIKKRKDYGSATQKMLLNVSDYIVICDIVSSIMYDAKSFQDINSAYFLSPNDIVSIFSRSVKEMTNKTSEKKEDDSFTSFFDSIRASWNGNWLKEIIKVTEDDSRFLKTRWANVDQILENALPKKDNVNDLRKKIVKEVIQSATSSMEDSAKLLARLALCEFMFKRDCENILFTDVMKIMCVNVSKSVSANEELKSMITEKSWTQLKILQDKFCESYPVVEGLLEKISSSADVWLEWMKSDSPEEVRLPGELSDATDSIRLGIISALRPDRNVQIVESVIASLDTEKLFVNANSNMSNILRNSRNSVPIVLLHDSRFSVESLVSQLSTLSLGKISCVQLGSDNSAIVTSVQRASQQGHWIVCKDLQSTGCWIDEQKNFFESVIATSKSEFRLILTANMSATKFHFPIWFLNNSSRHYLSDGYTLQDSLKVAWQAVPRQIFGSGKSNDDLKSILFGLCCLHACLQSRARLPKVGFTPFQIIGDASFAVQSLDALLSTIYGTEETSSKATLLKTINGSLTQSIYGSIFEYEADTIVNECYIKKVFHKGLFECGMILDRMRVPRASDMDYKGYEDYISSLDSNNDTEYMGLTGIDRFIKTTEGLALHSMFASIYHISSNIDEHKLVLVQIKVTIEEAFTNLPVTSEIKDRAELFFGEDRSVYLPILIGDTIKLNFALSSILDDIESMMLFLSGETLCASLNQRSIACLIQCLVPLSWQYLTWKTNDSIWKFSQRLLKASLQLKSWGDSMKIPDPLWLPGLCNAASIISCTKGYYLRLNNESRNLDFENIKIESHVLIGKRIRTDDTSDGQFRGILLSGLHLSACRWTDEEDDVASDDYSVDQLLCGGFLAKMRPWSLPTTMPTIYLKPVRVEAKQQVSQESSKKMRQSITQKSSLEDTKKISFCSCPVYLTDDRMHQVFSVDIRTNVDENAWKVCGAALIID